ncbi:MAG: AMP-binding protein [Gammaproteobacteria bacterium]|nr:AMP-binding protein [Gammaproteobacteria bacterium]
MTFPASLPLVVGDPGNPIARYASQRITRAGFLSDVMALSELLPENRHGLNLCTDRYHFLVAFAALLVSGHVNLLPHSAAPKVLDDLAGDYAAFRVGDEMVRAVHGQYGKAAPVPGIPAEREAAVLFTSGSTGRPAAQSKTWGELVGSSHAAIARFGLDSRHEIVATVPAQHSYGFESGALYALNGPAVIHNGKPLFPADVRDALAGMEAPRILVTTPLHLEACLEAGLDWPPLAFCLCATSPLSREAAVKAEATFSAPMREIYGSSETGAIASRRTATETTWTPYDGVRLHGGDSGFRVSAPFLPASRRLTDRFEIAADGRFEWRGRQADQIKIAGKRTTLAELNARLRAIAGVKDGGFILPEHDSKRLAAVVVAPGIEAEDIRAQLVEALDPVFLPRPLVKVESLQHTATGKLARAELLAHLEGRAKDSASS